MPACLLFKAKLLFVWQRARKGVGTLSWADPGTECDLLQDAVHVLQGTVLWESPALSSLVFQDLPAMCVSWEAKGELCQVQLLDVVNMSFWGGGGVVFSSQTPVAVFQEFYSQAICVCDCPAFINQPGQGERNASPH